MGFINIIGKTIETIKNISGTNDTLTITDTNGNTESIIINNVNNSVSTTKDANGNIITTTYAPLSSPSLTGIPIAPTAANGTNTTQIATTEFVTTGIKEKVSKSGDTITGNLTYDNVGGEFRLTNKESNIGVYISNSAVGLYDWKNDKHLLRCDQHTSNSFYGTAYYANYLNIINGNNVKFKKQDWTGIHELFVGYTWSDGASTTDNISSYIFCNGNSNRSDIKAKDYYASGSFIGNLNGTADVATSANALNMIGANDIRFNKGTVFSDGTPHELTVNGSWVSGSDASNTISTYKFLNGAGSLSNIKAKAVYAADLYGTASNAKTTKNFLGNYVFYNRSDITDLSGLSQIITILGVRSLSGTAITTLSNAQITDMLGGAIANCKSLKIVSLPAAQTIGDAVFDVDIALTTVTIGSDITSIASNAFSNCTQTDLTININRISGAITGAPWGATNATVNWTGTA